MEKEKDKARIRKMYENGTSYNDMGVATGKSYPQLCKIVQDLIKEGMKKRDRSRDKGQYRKGLSYADKSWEKTPVEQAITALKAAGRFKEKSGVYFVDGQPVSGNVTRRLCEMAGIKIKGEDARWI